MVTSAGRDPDDHGRAHRAELDAFAEDGARAGLLALVNGSPSLMFVKDTAFRYLFVNKRFAEYGPHSVDSMVGLTDHDITPKEVADALRIAEVQVLATNSPLEYEEEVPTPVGVRYFLTTKFPVHDETGALIGLAGMVTDITERKRREAERLAAHERVIAHQSDELRELSTPLLPIADGVLAMPLIGAISPARADEILHTLLRGISAQRARFALIDVTGVHSHGCRCRHDAGGHRERRPFARGRGRAHRHQPLGRARAGRAGRRPHERDDDGHPGERHLVRAAPLTGPTRTP
jgi:PAS domain S-box-containing protein